MQITIRTEDVADVQPTPRGAGLEASLRVVRYRNAWQINGRATHAVADTATLILGVPHAINEAKVGEAQETIQ